MRITALCLYLTLFFILGFGVPQSFAGELTINLIAVNPSDKDPKDIDVKYYLPKELEPSDVIESGDLKVNYDVDKSLYYISGKVNFQPKESKTFKIRVNDVWVITPEEINVLKQNMEGNLALLKGDPEKYENANREKEKMSQQLDIILAQQLNYADNIERRIEQYRAYSGMVETIRKKIYDPNYFDKEAQTTDAIETDKTIKFVLQVKNPSEKEKKTIKHRHYLPSEVHEEDILEKQGFDVRFDEKKSKSYLFKEEDFEGGEEKKYEVVMKDIWRFPVAKLDPIEQRAKTAMTEIANSAYEESGKYLYDELNKTLNLIRETQNFEVSTEEHIGIFRTNQKRYEVVKQDVERLEQMLAIVRAKKLEELEGSKVKNVLKKLQALRGLAAISEAIFKKGISVTTTWRIIAGAIGFIAFFTTWHFIIWSRRSGKMGEELGVKDGEKIKVVPKPTEAPKEK